MKLGLGSEPSYEMLASRFESLLGNTVDLFKSGFTSLEHLAFMLKLEGKPLSMKDHYMFNDMFAALPAKRTMYKAARQTAKTTTGVAANGLERIVRPNTKALIVTPFFRQVHRISTEVAAPMFGDGMFRDEISDMSTQQVLKRKYANGSMDHYGYAFQSVSGLRGLSGIDRIWIDEIQDMKSAFIPIIEQTSAARPYTAWKLYSGTPLSMGNPLQVLWEESSQAVETIKCEHCGRRNYACVEEHLLEMVGEKTCVCYHCKRPLDVMKKVFVPRYPDREDAFPGRHVSQVLHPRHALIPSQWRELRRNQETYTTAQFYNEVLGESYDSADRMIDHQALMDACTLGPNTLDEALKQRDSLELAGMGVDWTGGGDGESFTKVLFGGLKRGSSTLRILYMLALPKSMPIQAQVPEILRLVERFRPSIFAHDYSGHGWLFESLGLSLNLDRELIWPFEYGSSPNREVVYANEAKTGLRRSLHLDHTRSLFALFSMIKAGRVKFPDWMSQCNKDNNTRPVDDFMHMFAETRPGLRTGEYLYVKRDSGHSDDFCHAANFLATACWYSQGSYPSLPAATNGGARLQPTPEEVDGLEGEWANKPRSEGPYVV